MADKNHTGPGQQTRCQLITEARARAAAIRRTAASQTIRRPGLRLVISPAQALTLAMIEKAPPTLVELANGVADRYGYERLDDLMEAVDE